MKKLSEITNFNDLSIKELFLIKGGATVLGPGCSTSMCNQNACSSKACDTGACTSNTCSTLACGVSACNIKSTVKTD